ncbi:hypothetical protein [Caballeronia sordidicola]|uniref:Uncharacterized protein n=1 Tax=Caballeronia sordidicola TaxID=196367 RepID=A0A242MBT6_CABSO|nr:hypothetical protein [Caballeronia sordidicola]OTP68758.1 hypothetical protein PAMC26577_32400 [Caballeronia sordidicola]
MTQGALNQVLNLPDIQQRLEVDRSAAVGGTPERFGRFLTAEVQSGAS